MMPLVGIREVPLGQVRVDLRGRDIRMTQHALDRAQVRAPLEQMRGEAVAKFMGRQVTGDPGLHGVPTDPLEHRLSRHRAAPDRQEDEGAAPRRAPPAALEDRTPLLEPAEERPGGEGADGQDEVEGEGVAEMMERVG